MAIQNRQLGRFDMAIYHFHAQVINRSQGRSASAAAAYRSGTALTDERTGLTHDFTKKNDIIDRTILLPEEAPAIFRDRETLWNAVEAAEKRKDAQTAREINIALPRELNDEQNWQLALGYVNTEFVSKGMIADVAFHRGHGDANEEQPHVHIMLTTREVSKAGFGPKVRSWNDKALLLEWRAHWADACNARLMELGFDMRIDHRTLEAQGINLEPKHYRSGMVDKRTKEKFSEYVDLARRNGERLLKDPNIALTALTRQQSTFTHHDVARFVNRYTADTEQFNAVYAKIMTSKELVPLHKDTAGLDRFTTQELLAIEQNLLSIAEKKAQSCTHPVFPKRVEHLMAKNAFLSTEQETALRHIIMGSDLVSVVGFAGTGKSTMLQVTRAIWEKEGYRVQGMALSGIAAEGLEAGSGIGSHTLANRLIVWENQIETLDAQDILVVDEAGMIGSRQMHQLLSWAESAKAKVVLIGDPEQLQAIDAGAAFRAILERTGFSELSDIKRQRQAWQKEATRHFALQRTEEGLMAYARHDNVHLYETKAFAIEGLIAQWDEVRQQEPHKTQIMLAYTRDEVRALNEAARVLRHQAGELGINRLFMTDRGERTFAEGERLYFLKNDNQNMRVKNGSLGTIIQITGEQFSVRLDTLPGMRSREVCFSLKDYPYIDYGYAATVYKSQGVTVDRAHILASRYFDTHSTYVAMSRHREGADLHYSQDEFQSFNDLVRRLSRQRDKDFSLDYRLLHITEEEEKRSISLADKEEKISKSILEETNNKETGDVLQAKRIEVHKENFKVLQCVQDEVGEENLNAEVEALLNDPEAVEYADRAIKENEALAIIKELKAYEAGELNHKAEEELLQQMRDAVADNDVMLQLFIYAPEMEEKMHHLINAYPTSADQKEAEFSKNLVRSLDKDEDLEISL